MAVFEYQYRETPIHQLHPLTKFTILAVITLITGFILDPLVKAVLIIPVLMYAYLAKLPLKDYRSLLMVLCFTLLISQFIGSLFVADPHLFKVYPKDWAGTIVFPVTPEGFPIFGRTAVTYGGLLWMISGPLTAILVLILVAAHIYATSLNETVQALSSLRAPFPIIYMTMVALRFTPELVAQLNLIQRAQSLRGWRVNTRNPIKAIGLMVPIMTPISRHVIKSIDITSMSVQNRAFGLGPVTNISAVDMKTRDRIIIGAMLAFFVLMMVLIFGFNVGNL
jgi:energy-coupling factor transporter transmembrane protein EcfT